MRRLVFSLVLLAPTLSDATGLISGDPGAPAIGAKYLLDGYELRAASHLVLDLPGGRRVIEYWYLVKGKKIVRCQQVWFPLGKPTDLALDDLDICIEYVT